MSFGTWVVQEVDPAEQPIRNVITVPALTCAVVTQVIAGDEMLLLALQVIPSVWIREGGSPPAVSKPLKAKPVAKGEAELFAVPENVNLTLPPAGILVAVVNLI